MRVRPVRREDVAEVHAMICELAAYERSEHEVRATPELLEAALFADEPLVFGHVLVDGPEHETDQRADLLGFALWYVTFSTWEGRHGLYLEDLFVRPQGRGRGGGRLLLQALTAECVARGYPRLEWWVLDWNEPAIGFYRRLGAVPMDEWTVWRLTGDALREVSTLRSE